MTKRACIVNLYSRDMGLLPYAWFDTVKNDGTLDAGVVFPKDNRLWIVLSDESNPFTEGVSSWVTAANLKAFDVLTLTNDCFVGSGEYAHFNDSKEIRLDDNPKNAFGRVVREDSTVMGINSKILEILHHE